MTPATVKPGDRVRDNDPRMQGRVETVYAIETRKRPVLIGRRKATVETDYALVGSDGPRVSGIRLDRIHADGKPRRSGWSVVG